MHGAAACWQVTQQGVLNNCSSQRRHPASQETATEQLAGQCPLAAAQDTGRLRLSGWAQPPGAAPAQQCLDYLHHDCRPEAYCSMAVAKSGAQNGACRQYEGP